MATLHKSSTWCPTHSIFQALNASQLQKRSSGLNISQQSLAEPWGSIGNSLENVTWEEWTTHCILKVSLVQGSDTSIYPAKSWNGDTPAIPGMKSWNGYILVHLSCNIPILIWRKNPALKGPSKTYQLKVKIKNRILEDFRGSLLGKTHFWVFSPLI